MNWHPVVKKVRKTSQEKGYEYLKGNAEQIYQDLLYELSKQKTGKQMAAAVYFSFLMDIPNYAMSLPSTEELQNEIQTRCLMNDNMASELAAMYHELFSEDTVKSLQDSEEKGFRELCNQEWECSWETEREWHPRKGGGGVHVTCTYSAEYKFEISKPELTHQFLSGNLKKNPFLSDEDLAELLQNRINEFLNNEFEEYCEGDDYYPPVAEDFYADSTAEEICGKLGLKCIEFEGNGSTSDWEPDW